MIDKYTPDATIIAAAQNFSIQEQSRGREPVFTAAEVGCNATFRQRRLFESAITEYTSRNQPTVNALARANVDRFRFENYGAC